MICIREAIELPAEPARVWRFLEQVEAGAALDRLLARALPLPDLRRHIREEQQSLAAILDGDDIP